MRQVRLQQLPLSQGLYVGQCTLSAAHRDREGRGTGHYLASHIEPETLS